MLGSFDWTDDGIAPDAGLAQSFSVTFTPEDEDNYNTVAQGVMVDVAKATATVQLDNLVQTHDGDPKPVSVTTMPPDLTVTVTYDGLETVPSAIGTYAVEATVVDDNYEGSASDTLEIIATPIEALFEDWLENVMGQDPDDPDFAPDADYDGDGMTTWQEFIADTDPADASSVFKGVGEAVVDEQSVTFESSANRQYSLYYTLDLNDPEWVPVVTGVQGTGETMTLKDPVSRERAHYRLKVELLP